MKKKQVITLIFLFTTILCHSQSKIEGCIRDSLDKSLPDAGIMFYHSDSLIAIATSGKDGCFSLQMNSGQYVMHVMFMGYEEWVREIELPEAGLNLQEIKLKEKSFELQEIEISADKKMHEQKLNKDIFNIPLKVKMTSTDVFQVFTHIPQLKVDMINRNVSLVDNLSNIIMVNNIVRDKDYIELLKPEEIERIEIIRDPGMRFRGVGAIVNIIAKSPVKGQSGRINGQLFPVDFYNGNFSSNYTYVVDKVRMSVYGSGNFFNTNKPEVFNSKDVVTAGKLIHTDKQSGKLHGHSDGGQVSALVDYEISSKSFASLDASYQLSSSKGYSPYSGSVYSDGQKMYNFQDSTERYYHNDKYTASAYYQTKFTPNSSMNTQVRYETGIPENSVLYKEITDQGGTSNMHQEDKEHWQTLETQINFMQEIKKVKIEEGYRLYWMGNEMNNNVNGMADQSNHVQWRNYFYANLIGSIKEKFVYQAGTGFDISKVLLNGAINDRQNVLVPQVTFRYNINNKQNVRLNYNVYRQMTAYSWYLNPTPRYNIDTTKVSFGNPNLTPYYQHTFNSFYSIGGDKLYFSAGMGGSVSTNPITTLEYLGEDGIYYTTWVNANRNSSIFYNVSANYKFFNKLTVNVYGTINYNVLEDSRYSQLNMHYRSYYCGANVSLQLSKFYTTVGYSPQFRNPTQTGYTRNPDTGNIFLSYNHSNHLSFQIGIQNLFPQVNTKETYLHDYTEFYRRNNRDDHLAFFMGCHYRFAYGKQMEKNRNVKSY